MGRSGYSNDGYDDLEDLLRAGRWSAQIASAVRGRRGQRFLIDLLTALEALPERRLVSGVLVNEEGAVCALGALGKHRGVDIGALDTEDYEQLGSTFDIAEQLARETMYINDECGLRDDMQRWKTVRAWALRHLKPVPLTPSDPEPQK
jgi:hypothetical protein